MILLVSYALIILTFRKRRMLFKAKEVIYTGYEIYLYILSYVVLMTSCLLIYLHVVQVVSMTSPLIKNPVKTITKLVIIPCPKTNAKVAFKYCIINGIIKMLQVKNQQEKHILF